jgi:hypothetical protein
MSPDDGVLSAGRVINTKHNEFKRILLLQVDETSISGGNPNNLERMIEENTKGNEAVSKKMNIL